MTTKAEALIAQDAKIRGQIAALAAKTPNRSWATDALGLTARIDAADTVAITANCYISKREAIAFAAWLVEMFTEQGDA